MNTGTKVTLAFLGGAVAGAAALALLNRGKLDFEYLKPLATELLNKGMDLKDTLLTKMETLKDDLENLASRVEREPEPENSPAPPEDA